MKSSVKSFIILSFVMVSLVLFAYLPFINQVASLESNLRLSQENTLIYEPTVNSNAKNSTDFIKNSNVRYRQNATDFYNGSYDFNSDTVGSFPNDFTVFAGSSSSHEISSLESGHQNVMTTTDAGGTTEVIYPDNLIESSDGSIELWLKFDSYSGNAGFLAVDSASSYQFYMGADAGNFYLYDGVGNNIIKAYNTDWNHLSIDFSVSGGYKGLSAVQFRLRWNSENLGIYTLNNAEAINRIRIGNLATGGSQSVQHYDAIGLTWYENYTYGGNMIPYMENSTCMEVESYAFHETAPNWILENGTFINGTLGWNSYGTGSFTVENGLFYDPEGWYEDYPEYNNRHIAISMGDLGYSHIEKEFDNLTIGFLQLEFSFKATGVGNFTDVSTNANIRNSTDDLVGFINIKSNDNYTVNVTLGDNGANIETFATLNSNFTYKVRWYVSEYGQYVIINSTDYDQNENISASSPLVPIADNELSSIDFRANSDGVDINTFKFDNVHIYNNGVSLVSREYGYAQFGYYEIETTFGDVINAEGYFQVDTFYKPEQTDYFLSQYSIINLLSMANYPLDDYVMQVNNSMVITINPNGTLNSNFSSFTNALLMAKNGVVECNGVETLGADLSSNTYYTVDNKLFIYSEGNAGNDEGYTVDFNIENVVGTNYTFTLNKLARTNLFFEVGFYIYYTDGTADHFYLDTDVSSYPYAYENSFSKTIVNYKEIESFSFYLNGTESANQTSVLAGFENIVLKYLTALPFDPDTLHDSGIFDTLVPIVLIVAPTFLIYVSGERYKQGMGKKIFIPFMIFFAIIMFAMSLLPAWLFFITLIGLGSIVLLKYREKLAITHLVRIKEPKQPRPPKKKDWKGEPL